MKNVVLYYFLVTKDSGIPMIQYSFFENQEVAVDGVLLSGFISALSMFISEVSNKREKNIQFAQYNFEGIIEHIGDKFYTIIGENLFSYSAKFYSQLFYFIDKYYISKGITDSSQLLSLSMAIFEPIQNIDIQVPHIVKEEAFIWSDEAKKVFQTIDGEKNIKELSVALELPIDVVFAVIKILELMSVVEVKLEFRDYVIFEKTPKALLLKEEYPEDYAFLKENFPNAIELLNYINSVENIRSIKEKFPLKELDNDIYALIEKNLIRTISSDKHLLLLLSEYLTSLLENLHNELQKRKKLSLIKNLKFSDNPLGTAINGGKVDFMILHNIFEALYYEQMVSISKIFNFVEPILNKIQELTSTIDPELPKQIIGKTIIATLDKYGFTLERFNLLEILCPVKYVE